MTSTMKSTWIIAVFLSVTMTTTSGSDQFRVDAKGPPRLIPSNYVRRHMVRAGSRLRLPCPVVASPAALVHWEKDGDLVRLGWDRYRVRPDDSSLMIRDLQMDDTGVFKCHATNGFGSIDVTYLVYVLVDANAALPVDFDEKFFEEMHQKGVAPEFTRQAEMKASSQLILTTGQMARLHCRATGRPRVNVLWFKDNKMLSSDTSSSSSLLSNDYESQWNTRPNTPRGTRRRRSDTDVDEQQPHQLRDVGQRHPQRMTSSSLSQRQNALTDVTAASSSGLDAPRDDAPDAKDVASDGEQLDEEYDEVDDEDRLMLRLDRVTIQDTGSYTCRVFNKAGSINFTYSVQVVDPASVRIQKPLIVAPYPQNVTAIVGDSAVMRCHISSGSSVPRVQWLRRIETTSFDDVTVKSRDGGEGEPYAVLQRTNGHSEVSATSTEGLFHSTLTISDVTEDDTGFYVCSVATSDGELSWRMYLNVITGGASKRIFHNDVDQQMSTVFAVVVSVTCCFAVLGVVAVVWVVIRHRRRQRNGMTSSRRSKCPAMSPLADAGASAGDSMQRACTTPLITSFRLPPLPVAPPAGRESNYENEHSYEHHYDVLEYRVPADCVAGQRQCVVGGKATSLEQMYSRQSGGYSPWPPHHVTHYPTASRAGSGLVYYDRR